MKLPKGIKRLRASASEEVLQRAIDLATSGTFNGYIRATAPKGIKEAGVVLFVQGEPRLAVFQSPQRSLYGPDALPEIHRIAENKDSFLRLEEFLAQSMEEVDTIVRKMGKAKVRRRDVEHNLRVRAAGKPKAPEPTREIHPEVKATKTPPTDEPGEEEATTEDEEPEVEAGEGPTTTPPGEVAKKGPGIRAKVEERIARSQAQASKEDEDILRMLKEVGMSPIEGEEEPKDDEVNQYIAAFEDFLKRQRDSGTPSKGAVVDSTQTMLEADEIIDEMLDAAGDDPTLMEFIEDQRERIINRLAAEEMEAATDRMDRLTQQQSALEHISKTFRDVLRASERERETQRSLIKDADEGKVEELEETEQRMDSLGEILERVLSTHRERLEGVEEELMEAEAATQLEAEVTPESLDLDKAKQSFLQKMRSRIAQAGEANGAALSRGGVAEATHSVSEGIHERVEELEQERETLARERQQLEDQEEVLERQVGELQVDQAVEVQARLGELKDREERLEKRDGELKDREERLLGERQKVAEDLAKARKERERIKSLEEGLQEREERLRSREGEVEGLREHLEDEIAGRASELEGMEERLKTWEKELLAKEKELDASMEAVRKEREEGVEADLEHVKGIEAELKKREKEYKTAIAAKEEVIEAMREELQNNIARVEELEGKLVALSTAEARIKELEDKLAAAAVSGGAKAGDDLDRDELRKLLAYLDDLLSKLPEEEIGRFSISEYFELYGRILDKLGI